MKTLLILAVLSLGLSTNTLASPLLYKAIKTVETDALSELTMFDATKYRQIRIGVQIIGADTSFCGLETPTVRNFKLENELDVAKRNVSIALREWERADQLYSGGVASKASLDESKDRLEQARKEVENLTKQIDKNKILPVLKYPCSSIRVFGGSGGEMMGLLGEISSTQIGGRFFVIDSPPTEIRFTAFGKGKYAIYIWGQ